MPDDIQEKFYHDLLEVAAEHSRQLEAFFPDENFLEEQQVYLANELAFYLADAAYLETPEYSVADHLRLMAAQTHPDVLRAAGIPGHKLFSQVLQDISAAWKQNVTLRLRNGLPYWLMPNPAFMDTLHIREVIYSISKFFEEAHNDFNTARSMGY